MKFVFGLLLLCISFNLNHCQCTIDADTDYLGSPISNDLSFTPATSYSDCCAKCSAQTEANCAAWTFVSNTCFFKSGQGLKINSPGSKYICFKIFHILYFLKVSIKHF